MGKTQKVKQSGFYKTFAKAQTAALAATLIDFGVYIALVELFAVWYVAAAVVGAILGALCNFMLGRHWCFYAQDGHINTQGIRYLIVSSMSLLLNTTGIYALTDLLGMHYVLSKVVIAIIVAVFFNFPLQKHYVFKRAYPS